MLAEIFWAQQVLAHFAQVDSLRQTLFISQGAELPAIGSDLELQAAADAQVSYNLENAFADVFEIIGAIAGAAFRDDPAAGALFSITGDLMSMLPSSSNTLTGKFDTTYSGLQTQFANSVSGVDKALAEHSQEVRQDLGLVSLVGQLRARGTWALDAVGAGSAGSEGFALWAYQTLMPAIYGRYEITNRSYPNDPQASCSGPSAGELGVIGGGAELHRAGSRPAEPGHELRHALPTLLRAALLRTPSPADLASRPPGAGSAALGRRARRCASQRPSSSHAGSTCAAQEWW
jgi:hypothetical protein